MSYTEINIKIRIEEWRIHFSLGILLLILFAACIYLAITINLVFAIPAFLTFGWGMSELQRGWES